jgi:hypothetical protein
MNNNDVQDTCIHYQGGIVTPVNHRNGICPWIEETLRLDNATFFGPEIERYRASRRTACAAINLESTADRGSRRAGASTPMYRYSMAHFSPGLVPIKAVRDGATTRPRKK